MHQNLLIETDPMIETDLQTETNLLIETEETPDLMKDQTTLITTPIEIDPPPIIEADMILTEIDPMTETETTPAKGRTPATETTQIITQGVVTTPTHTTLTETTPAKDPTPITEVETTQMTDKIAIDAITKVDPTPELDQLDLSLETPQQTTPAIDPVQPL